MVHDSQFNPKTGNIETLRFERYGLNLALLIDNEKRKWIDPDEQTLTDIYALPKDSLDQRTALNIRTAIRGYI